MNTTTDNKKRQSESTKSEKLSRAKIHRQEKSAAKSMTAWMVAQGISVVQVNPYAVKQTKDV